MGDKFCKNGCLPFLFNVREGSSYADFCCSAVDVAAEASSWYEASTSLFWNCSSDWDVVSSTSGSIFTLSLSSLENWLMPTRIVRVEFSGCIKEAFKTFLILKIAGTVFVFYLNLNRGGLHKTIFVFACRLILRPRNRSTGVSHPIIEILWYVISALCSSARKDTLKLGIHASLSELLLQLVHWLFDDRDCSLSIIPCDSQYCLS